MLPNMITGPQQKFCEGIVAEKSAAEAYADAYPRAARGSTESRAASLLDRPGIQEEITRLRGKTEPTGGGSAVLTLLEKRSFLARIVRSRPALLGEDSDLWQSVKRMKDSIELKLPDKLSAIAKDSDLAGEGSNAEADDALSNLLATIRR